MIIKAYAAIAGGAPLQPFEYDPGAIGPEDVDIAVSHCGICHSDLSMLNNDWEISQYPFVPGHEVVGRIESVGPQVDHLSVGQRSLGALPLGSPVTIGTMLDFAARHAIAPLTESFPMSRANDAMERLRSGKPRYRIVLENDF